MQPSFEIIFYCISYFKKILITDTFKVIFDQENKIKNSNNNTIGIVIIYLIILLT